MKVAILLWGCVRGLKYQSTFDSQKKHIWDKLEDFDVYICTSNKEYDDIIHTIPNTRHIKIFDDRMSEDFIMPKTTHVIMPSYFKPFHKSNLMKCFLYQKYLRDHIVSNKLRDQYDVMITMDMAHVFESDIPDPSTIDPNIGYVSSTESFNGINPRFFMSSPSNVLFYLNKLEHIMSNPANISGDQVHPRHRSHGCNYHPECSLKYYLEQVCKMTLKPIPLTFWRVRENGDVTRDE